MPRKVHGTKLGVESLEERLNLAPAAPACPVDNTADVLNAFEPPIDVPVTLTSAQGPRVFQDRAGKWIIQSLHRGVDFGVAQGTPVQSVAMGKVVIAKFHKDLGNYVVIQHADHQGKPVYTWYQHLAEINVTAGQCVDNDTEVGTVGSTGLSTNPHLHLNVGWVAKPTKRASDWINPRLTSAFTAAQKSQLLALEQSEQREYDLWQRGEQFNGSYSGSYEGTVTAFGFSQSIGGGVQFSVQNGRIVVTVPSAGQGTISGSDPKAKFASGAVSVPGVSCRFGGSFHYVDESNPDVIVARGSWLCKFRGGVASGTWSAVRS